MAHLWRFDEDDWTILPLCDEAYLLDEWPPGRVTGVGDWLDAQAESGALSERLAELTSLPVTRREICCPRCRDIVRPGTPAVQCPRCDVWHHQEADRPCWMYADGCAACGHATALDAGFTWTPES